MTLHLTKFQKKLCNVLQDGLPICARPFDKLAKRLNSDEETVLQETRELKKLAVIRRISAIINYRAAGLSSTLVAAHIPHKKLNQVVKVINSLENVSHNYQRQHHYNLWFTLQARSEEEINLTLSNLSERFDITFHSLPVVRVFKLDVRFDAEAKEGLSSQDVRPIPKNRTVELTGTQKRILSKIQDGFDITPQPFEFLANEGFDIRDILGIIRLLIDEGVIRRIAAVVDHRKLGFVANVLFVCEVPQDRIIRVGERLTRLAAVSHCYERETFENWPYNLFAMMHDKTMTDIQCSVNDFTAAEKIYSFTLLPTVAELKKQPVKYRFF